MCGCLGVRRTAGDASGCGAVREGCRSRNRGRESRRRYGFRSRLTKDRSVCYGLNPLNCEPSGAGELNRESRAIRERSRRCERGRNPHKPLESREGVESRVIREPEDLPDRRGRRYVRLPPGSRDEASSGCNPQDLRVLGFFFGETCTWVRHTHSFPPHRVSFNSSSAREVSSRADQP